MIKQLITDIAYDNIDLSKALTKAKLIADKVKNSTFKQWLSKELTGYDYNDTMLPDYRKIRRVIYLTIALPFNQQHTFPLSFSDVEDENFLDIVHFHRVIEQISIVEQHLEQVTTSMAQQPLTPEQVENLGGYFIEQINSYGGVLQSGYFEVGKAQLQNIIELTKQKLLDTLLELNNEFPDLTDDFTITKDNVEKVQNIITNNIYGENNPMNIAAGQYVEQRDISNVFSSGDYSELEKLGVQKDEIEELKQIVAENGKDKTTLKQKAIKWLGSVSASVAARGLYENIPTISEFISKLV